MDHRWLILTAVVAVATAAAGPAEPLASSSPERLSEVVGENVAQVSARLASLSRQLAAAAAEAPGKPAPRDAALRSAIEDILKVLKLIFDFIVKLMDPTPLGNYAWHFDGALARGNLSLQKLQARHLRNLKLLKYDINISTMCAGISILLPQLTLQSNYDVDINLNLEEDSDFRLFGNGAANVDMWDVQLDTDLCVTVNPITAKVEHMKLSVANANVDLQKLFNDPPLSKQISRIASDVLPPMVQEFQKEITEFVMKYINKLIEEKMPDGSTNHILLL